MNHRKGWKELAELADSEQDDLARELYGVDANAANTVGMNSPQNIIDAALATVKSSAGVKSLVVVSEYMKVKRAIYEAMSKFLANCSKVGDAAKA